MMCELNAVGLICIQRECIAAAALVPLGIELDRINLPSKHWRVEARHLVLTLRLK